MACEGWLVARRFGYWHSHKSESKQQASHCLSPLFLVSTAASCDPTLLPEEQAWRIEKGIWPRRLR